MNIRILLWITLSMVILSSCGGIAQRDKGPETLDVAPDPPKVGQWFQYQHTGPRPWGDGRVDSSGTRLIRVIGKQEEKNKTFRVIEESFDSDVDEQTSLYDDRYFLHRQLAVSNVINAVFEYKPPISERHIDLQRDQSKVQQATILMQNPVSGTRYGTVQLKRTTARKRDERIVTEAGAFLCRHFVSETELQYEQQGNVTKYSATENTYWCDQLAWFVLERVEFQPVLQAGEFQTTGHVAESILVDFEQNP